MPATPELLDRQLNVSISRRMETALLAVESTQGLKGPQFARLAIEEKIRGDALPLTRLAAEFRRLGGDPEAALCAAIDDFAQRVLAQPASR